MNGTQTRFYFKTGTAAELLEEGDILRNESGRCYLIETLRPSTSKYGNLVAKVTRLGYDAASLGDPGVYLLTRGR